MADEVGYLQSRPARGPEAELFQVIAEQGHYAGRSKPSTTRQGTYAATAGGKLLASANTNDPDRMAAMLEKALAAWKTLPPGERTAEVPHAREPEGRRRLEEQYPEDGLVLHHFVRDLPREQPQTDRYGRAWNQDFAWFTREEARSMLPREIVAGARHDVPVRLVRRLATRHLLDTVRGQTSPFRDGDVKEARLSALVESVADGKAAVVFEGATRTVQRGRWQLRGFRGEPQETERGYAPRILGRATWDVAKGEFSEFELLAVGPRWGGTKYNGRGGDLETHPMGVAFRKARTRDPVDRVAPAHAWNYFK